MLWSRTSEGRVLSQDGGVKGVSPRPKEAVSPRPKGPEREWAEGQFRVGVAAKMMGQTACLLPKDIALL